MGSGPIPMRLEVPMLFDTGAVVGTFADPGATVAGSKYSGRIFYLRRKDWALTQFPDTISPSEAASYKAHGLTIVLNFEDAQPDWCLGGYAAGKDRGDWCAGQLTAIDCEHAHVYMSVDFQPVGNQMDAVMECLRGFADSALGTRGRAVYGFAPVMREAKARDLADFYWMAGDGRDLFVGDWRAGVRAPDLAHVQLWQQNNEQPWQFGVRIDDNYVLTPDFGQWQPQEVSDMADEAQQIVTQLMGPDGAGFEILGKAVETDPSRFRYLTEALAVILVQLCGDPNFGGWTQLGDGPDSDTPKRTLVNAVAQVLRQNEQILAQNAQILAALTPKE